jgi:RNase adaptor protein for sRNA GlmZ degradation
MLNIKIHSFSYKKTGIPVDASPNGGGFVFDCRYIYNPGREESFKSLTGCDKQIIDFIDKDDIMGKFLANVYGIIDGAVDNYLKRNFTNLHVSFGCTGGQHRSVYASEKLYAHLKEKYGSKIHVTLEHREFPELSKI